MSESREGRSRRDFLATSGSTIGSAWLVTHLAAIQVACADARDAAERGAGFETLTADQAAELEAIAAQIFPTDDTPGAREAGVIYFIDRALGGFMASSLEAVRQGLEELRASVEEANGDGTTFAALDFETQTATLRAIEDGPFFKLVHQLTVLGMFSHPDYGGNRDEIGWRMVGFEDRSVWEPPFGYYDAEASEGEGGSA